MMPGRLLAAIACLALGLGCSSSPQQSAGAIVDDGHPRPTVTVPRLARAPQIDGRLDDWAGAAAIDGLGPFLGGDYQARIDESPTTIRLAWTPDALYIAFDCSDSSVFVKPRMGDAETSLHHGDLVEVFVDADGDGQSWWELQVNPIGQTFDKRFWTDGVPAITATGRVSEAYGKTHMHTDIEGFSLDGVQVASHRRLDGWSVEMSIPAHHFGGRLSAGSTLRANLARYKWEPTPESDDRALLGMIWSPVQHGCPHISPSRHGVLYLAD